MQDWCELAVLLPKLHAADGLRAHHLQAAAFCAWKAWTQRVAHNKHAAAVIVARWADLHLSAAWQAWKEWVAQRRAKAPGQGTTRRQAVAEPACLLQPSKPGLSCCRSRSTVRQLWRQLPAVRRSLHAASGASGAWKSYVPASPSRPGQPSTKSLFLAYLHLAAALHQLAGRSRWKP